MYLDIILPVPSSKFQDYDTILCDTLCDHGHVPLYCPRNKIKIKIKIKSKKID